jgi:hypothetical protein
MHTPPAEAPRTQRPPGPRAGRHQGGRGASQGGRQGARLWLRGAAGALRARPLGRHPAPIRTRQAGPGGRQAGGGCLPARRGASAAAGRRSAVIACRRRAAGHHQPRRRPRGAPGRGGQLQEPRQVLVGGWRSGHAACARWAAAAAAPLSRRAPVPQAPTEADAYTGATRIPDSEKVRRRRSWQRPVQRTGAAGPPAWPARQTASRPASLPRGLAPPHPAAALCPSTHPPRRRRSRSTSRC